MNTLSREKLIYFKNKKNLTNKAISELSELPISTIDKLFSGLTNNPTLDTLKKIADVLECGIDDFINYDAEPLEGGYFDRQTAKIAKAIQGNKELKDLLDITADLSKEDLKLIQKVVRRMNLE